MSCEDTSYSFLHSTVVETVDMKTEAGSEEVENQFGDSTPAGPRESIKLSYNVFVKSFY